MVKEDYGVVGSTRSLGGVGRSIRVVDRWINYFRAKLGSMVLVNFWPLGWIGNVAEYLKEVDRLSCGLGGLRGSCVKETA